jgi:hypothetical protein
MSNDIENELSASGVLINRRRALGLLGAGFAAAGAPTNIWSTALNISHQPLLGTPDQRAAERVLMRLMKDPDVIQQQARIKTDIMKGDIAKTQSGSVTIDRAITQWTRSLIFNEIGLHRMSPAFLWSTDDTPRTWFGYTLGGVGAAGDNPDNLYRTTSIEGSKNYEVLGWIDQNNPAEQLVVQIDKIDLTDPASMYDMDSKMPSMVSATIRVLSDRDLDIAPDGSFRITLGSGEQGPVHVPLKPGGLVVSTRDLMADWHQRPCRLAVRELGSSRPMFPAAAEPIDHTMIKRNLLQHMPRYIGFWAKFPEIWFGGLKPNTISAPRGRVGGWGFVAGLNFLIKPDEAVIVTTTRGAAAYTGFQLNDPWMIQSDAKKNQICLNSSQARPSPDGSFTYVISQTDPGVTNWLDTVGLDSGIGLLRWQKVPKDMTGDGLIREFRVTKLSEVAGMAQLPRVTPEQRRAEIASRAAAYGSRAA